MAMPSIVVNTGEVAPTFNSIQTEMEASPSSRNSRLGETPLDPTELNTETLKQFEAKPIASQTELIYDDSPNFGSRRRIGYQDEGSAIGRSWRIQR